MELLPIQTREKAKDGSPMLMSYLEELNKQIRRNLQNRSQIKAVLNTTDFVYHGNLSAEEAKILLDTLVSSAQAASISVLHISNCCFDPLKLYGYINRTQLGELLVWFCIAHVSGSPRTVLTAGLLLASRNSLTFGFKKMLGYFVGNG